MSPYAVLMLIRPRQATATITRLQITASGVTTLLTFAVTILSTAFWRVPSDETGYQIMAIALVGLLLVPLVTLGTATARLAARSRDDRLATLRLIGATATQVRRIAVSEVTLIAAVGVIIGTVLSVGLPLVLSQLPMYGEPLSAAQLWPS